MTVKTVGEARRWFLANSSGSVACERFDGEKLECDSFPAAEEFLSASRTQADRIAYEHRLGGPNRPVKKCDCCSLGFGQLHNVVVHEIHELNLCAPCVQLRLHEECGFSTGICGRITAGTGELDANGYWEFPCEQCASAMTFLTDKGADTGHDGGFLMKGTINIVGMGWETYKRANRMRMVELITSGCTLLTLNMGWVQPSEENQVQKWEGSGAVQYILL
jgi:hypothetical protein